MVLSIFAKIKVLLHYTATLYGFHALNLEHKRKKRVNYIVLRRGQSMVGRL
jgi:hypothetical protein